MQNDFDPIGPLELAGACRNNRSRFDAHACTDTSAQLSGYRIALHLTGRTAFGPEISDTRGNRIVMQPSHFHLCVFWIDPDVYPFDLDDVARNDAEPPFSEPRR